jgi:hypothetical protein
MVSIELGFLIWTDRRPCDGVHRAARPVGQLVNTSQHVNGSESLDTPKDLPEEALRSRGHEADDHPASPRGPALSASDRQAPGRTAVDLDLVEPARMGGQVDQGQVLPAALQPVDRALATV